jgi:uncharacterized membrane protein
MATLSKFIEINAPVEKVYEYLSDPYNTPEFWPSFQEVQNVQDLSNGGHKFHWVYKMAGVRFEGDTEDIEVIPGKRTVSKSTGGIPSTFIWEFQPTENGGTIVTMNIDYSLPNQLLGRLAEPFLLKLNEREADTLLANLKARTEM